MKPSTAEHADFFTLIAANAVQTENVMRADLAAAPADSDPLLHEVLEYALLGGGKRLRSFLTAVCARLCGGGEKKISLLAAAFEYLHTATLIHDDVIDHAADRRGKASVVRKYGMTAAILAGDWLHARSMRLIGSLAGAEALEIFCTATADMVDGEFLQMRHAENLAVTEEQYFSVIKKKTAGLIRAACAVGALHGQGSPEQVAALALYGEKIGLAFQIADDLLDYLGEEEQTGKETGNDFAEGKMTLPLIHAFRHAAPQDKELLRRSVAAGQRRSADTFAAVRSILAQNSSFVYCRSRAEEEMQTGLSALSCFTRQEQEKDIAALRSLADYVLNREG
jgi:octaprenyl-diphosphate synthase